MTTVTDEYDYVVGVDTHAKTHTYAVLAADTGRAIDSAMFPTSPTGISRALAWMQRRADGRLLIAIEGAGSYGAVIARVFQDAGLAVCDVRPPKRAARAGRESLTRSTQLLQHARRWQLTSSGLRSRARTGSAPPCGFC